VWDFIYIIFNTISMSKEKLNYLVDAFVWRFFNTMKASWLPATLLVLLTELEKAQDVAILADMGLWRKVAFAGLVAVLTSVLAGLDKVQRENVRLEE
jgi:hypothetical protein